MSIACERDEPLKRTCFDILHRPPFLRLPHDKKQESRVIWLMGVIAMRHYVKFVPVLGNGKRETNSDAPMRIDGSFGYAFRLPPFVV
jgi:hypothetical protein